MCVTNVSKHIWLSHGIYEWVMVHKLFLVWHTCIHIYTIVGLTHLIDWSCFHDSIRNRLVVLWKLYVLKSILDSIYRCYTITSFALLFRNMSHERVLAYQLVRALMNESWRTGYPRTSALAFIQNSVSGFETWKPHASFIYMFTYIVYIYIYVYVYIYSIYIYICKHIYICLHT